MRSTLNMGLSMWISVFGVLIVIIGVVMEFCGKHTILAGEATVEHSFKYDIY